MATKTQRIADDLRRRLSGQEWNVDDQIPVLEVLCESYDASGATVRRAQGLLSSEGLLRSEQGRGVYVVAHPKAPAADGRTEALAAIDTVMDLLTQVRTALGRARSLLADA